MKTNGLIIQWGNLNGSGTITLPTPFSNTSYQVATTCSSSNTISTTRANIVSNTQLRLDWGENSVNIRYIAIGY